MNIKDMHFDFKQKLNVVDSQRYRDILIPVIDWRLNEAQELYVKMIAEPRIQAQVGFELNQRTIDDIRTVVVNQTKANGQVPNVFDASDGSYVVTLPDNYMYYVGSMCYATKGVCTDKIMRVEQIQHDDEAEISPFDKSSFEWRVLNIRFIKEGIRVFTDKTFTPTKLCLNYIMQPPPVWNAEDFEDGTYEMLDGTTRAGTQDCKLPEQVHREVVDLAVFITAGDLNMASYGIKANKVKMNQP